MAEPAPAVHRSALLPAPPGRVWSALVDPWQLTVWFGGEAILDPRPGGDGWFRTPSGELRRARVERVEESRRLVFRWWPRNDPAGEEDASTVEITLTDAPGGTRLTVVERAPAESPPASASWEAVDNPQAWSDASGGTAGSDVEARVAGFQAGGERGAGVLALVG